MVFFMVMYPMFSGCKYTKKILIIAIHNSTISNQQFNNLSCFVKIIYFCNLKISNYALIAIVANC